MGLGLNKSYFADPRKNAFADQGLHNPHPIFFYDLCKAPQ